jgi:formiminoglutamase
MLEAAVLAQVRGLDGHTYVANGRFRGGWTTRHNGRPEAGVHAIQMELAQSTHLAAEAPPWALDPARAARLRGHLADILAAIADLAPDLGATHA